MSFFKEVAWGGERTRVLSISFIIFIFHLFTSDPQRLPQKSPKVCPNPLLRKIEPKNLEKNLGLLLYFFGKLPKEHNRP
jgi:hypothetical protein